MLFERAVRDGKIKLNPKVEPKPEYKGVVYADKAAVGKKDV
jgi:hypothetical protein